MSAVLAGTGRSGIAGTRAARSRRVGMRRRGEQPVGRRDLRTGVRDRAPRRGRRTSARPRGSVGDEQRGEARLRRRRNAAVRAARPGPRHRAADTISSHSSSEAVPPAHRRSPRAGARRPDLRREAPGIVLRETHLQQSERSHVPLALRLRHVGRRAAAGGAAASPMRWRGFSGGVGILNTIWIRRRTSHGALLPPAAPTRRRQSSAASPLSGCNPAMARASVDLPPPPPRQAPGSRRDGS